MRRRVVRHARRRCSTGPVIEGGLAADVGSPHGDSATGWVTNARRDGRRPLVLPAGSSFLIGEGFITGAANPAAMASAVEITLSDEERAELERRAAKLTLPYRDVQRAKVVLYAADGLSNVEIATRLGMCSKVVGQWRRRFCEQRLAGLEDLPRSGRPRRFPPARGRAGQGDRVRAAQDARRAALALQPV